jgi:hypothetical protein
MQGFFSGIYNALAGRVRHNQSDVGDISGRWDQVMEFKSAKVCKFVPSNKATYSNRFALQTGNKRVLFDAAKDGHNVAPKFVPEEDEQEPNESRR